MDHSYQPLVSRPRQFAEIGIFAGGSLKMWRWYFGPRANITGIDLAGATRAYERNAEYGSPDQILVGSQGDESFLREVHAT